jgi:hypothetical protein
MAGHDGKSESLVVMDAESRRFHSQSTLEDNVFERKQIVSLATERSEGKRSGKSHFTWITAGWRIWVAKPEGTEGVTMKEKVDLSKTWTMGRTERDHS